MKPKSRWLQKAEPKEELPGEASPSAAEMDGKAEPELPSLDLCLQDEPSSSPTPESPEPREDAAEKGEAPASPSSAVVLDFEILQESVYLCEGNGGGKKDGGSMRCDCRADDDGEGPTCGVDCLNRLLYIECRAKCSGGRCSNQRMRRGLNADVEPFMAGAKGRGLRTRQRLHKDDFIMEYVGEVMNGHQMVRRMRKYAKDADNKHHYCMALKNDLIIDATLRGSISRFINHSCDPNSATQKWTVNGCLRVGFFALRTIEPGEELTFDYKFERFGKTAQKCLCGAANCRGVIGVETKESKESKESSPDDREAEKERRRKERRRRDLLKDEKQAEELEALASRGRLSCKMDVVQLARLMVRGDDFAGRQKMLALLGDCEENVLRLFLDFSGLNILRIWLADDPMLDRAHLLQIRIQVLDILKRFPEPFGFRSLLEDSGILEWVSKESSESGSPEPTSCAVEAEVRRTMAAVLETLGSPPSTPSSDSHSHSATPNPGQGDEERLKADLRERCVLLMEQWKSLKTDRSFKIPKRSAQEREKAAAEAAATPRSSHTIHRSKEYTRGYEQSRPAMPRRDSWEERPRERRRESRRSPTPPRRARRSRSDVRSSPPDEAHSSQSTTPVPKRRKSRFDIGPGGDVMKAPSPKVLPEATRTPVEERRRAFEAQVEEEEAKVAAESQRLQASAMDMEIEDSDDAPAPLNALPSTPSTLPNPLGLPKPGRMVVDPVSGAYWWQDPTSGHLVYAVKPEQHAAAMRGDWSRTPHFHYDPGSGNITEVTQGLPLPPKPPVPPPVPAPAGLAVAAQSQEEILALKQKVALLEQQLRLKTTPQEEPTSSTAVEPVVTELPPMWRQAKDTEGNVYYYNTITRETQWEVPTEDTGPSTPTNPTVIDIGDEPPSPSPEVASTSALTAVVPVEEAAAPSSTTMAAADTSSVVTRKLREDFKAKVSASVRKWLTAYQRPEAKAGRITSTDDFKHLARKLTHVIFDKELKRSDNRSENMKITDSVLQKAKTYVRGYMERQGPVYVRKTDSK